MSIVGLMALAIVAQAAPVGAQAGQVGRDIAAIARENGKTEQQVSAILADPTARVDARNRLHYVDPVPAASGIQAVEAAPYPYTQTFTLHSRPGSQRTIYLDFDGLTVVNTAWNGSYGAPTGSFYAEPFSLDASTAFSTAEQDIIQSVWQRVSEDFAPFNVDVTTQDPGVDAITRSSATDLVYGTRALITDATEIRSGTSGCNCGGIAYLGVFDESASHARYQPAFIFAEAMSNNVKSIAEAVSHEVGHNFDLSHDGTASTNYYGGHGSWAPIMGVGYNRPIVQWSRGEYTGANQLQNDLDLIALNGAAVLGDDHGNTAATARALGTGPNVAATGVITTDADIDVFRVDAGAGAASFAATPGPVSPNLDILLELRNSAGGLMATNNPASATVNSDVASGVSASISTNLPAAGSYYLFVSGVGTGNATTGYSGYASIGRYTFSGTVVAGSTTSSIAIANATVNEGAAGANTTATFNVTLSPARSSTVTVVASTAGGTATAGTDFTSKSATVTFAAGTTSSPFTVTVLGDATAEANETFTVNLTSASGATLSDAQGVGTIMNDDSSAPANDHFASATALGASGALTATNVNATKQAGEPNHAGFAGGHSIWYRWTAPGNGPVSVDTFGSNFDTMLGIYIGTAVDALTTVASNDDAPNTIHSRVTFNATGGVVYRIAVDGYAGTTGTVKLNWVQDNVLPIVSWTAPVMNGQTYNVGSGIVTLATAASDNSGVAQVSFLRWDAPRNAWVGLGSRTAAPWQTTLDVATLNMGWNQVNAQVWDTMGNYGASPYIWIYRTGASVASPAPGDAPDDGPGPGRGVGPPAPRPTEPPAANLAPAPEPSPSKPAE